MAKISLHASHGRAKSPAGFLFPRLSENILNRNPHRQPGIWLQALGAGRRALGAWRRALVHKPPVLSVHHMYITGARLLDHAHPSLYSSEGPVSLVPKVTPPDVI